MMPESAQSHFKIPVQRPEWLTEGLVHAERVFRLAREGRIPESVPGWMLQTACLRVLRAIHGDDLATATAIRDYVIAKELRALEPPPPNCPICGEALPDGCLCV